MATKTYRYKLSAPVGTSKQLGIDVEFSITSPEVTIDATYDDAFKVEFDTQMAAQGWTYDSEVE